MPTSPPLLLFVCTGNICRSPLAAHVLAHALSGAGLPDPLRVESAGTAPLSGAPMDDSSALIVRRLGADPVAHRARHISAALLAEASLVLTATRQHRGAVVEVLPRAVQYTWTLRQAGAILERSGWSESPKAEHRAESESDPDEPAAGSGLVALGDFLKRHRGLHYQPDRSADDVIDPYRQPEAVHEQAASEMLPALSLLSQALGGAAIEWPVVAPR